MLTFARSARGLPAGAVSRTAAAVERTSNDTAGSTSNGIANGKRSHDSYAEGGDHGPCAVPGGSRSRSGRGAPVGAPTASGLRRAVRRRGGARAEQPGVVDAAHVAGPLTHLVSLGQVCGLVAANRHRSQQRQTAGWEGRAWQERLGSGRGELVENVVAERPGAAYRHHRSRG